MIEGGEKKYRIKWCNFRFLALWFRQSVVSVGCRSLSECKPEVYITVISLVHFNKELLNIYSKTAGHRIHLSCVLLLSNDKPSITEILMFLFCISSMQFLFFHVCLFPGVTVMIVNANRVKCT